MAHPNNSPRSRGRGMAHDKPKNFRKSMAMLLATIKPFLPAIITSLIFAVAGTVFAIIGPNISKKLSEEIIKGTLSPLGINFRNIAIIGMWLIIFYVVSSLCQFFQSYLMAGVTAKLSKDLRNQISEKINKLPLKYFDKTSYGDVLSRVTNDLDTIGSSLNQSLSSIISSVTTVVGALIMMFINSWKLTLIGLISAPVSLILVGIIVKISQKHFIRQQRELGDINGHIEEIYSNHNVVKVFNGEDDALQKFDVINTNLFKSNYKANFLGGLMHPAMNFVGNIIYGVVAVVGGIMAIENPIFAATIIAFVSYIRMFNNNVSQIANVGSTLQSTAAASERVFEFLTEPEELDESSKKKFRQKFVGNVEFENVCFGYDPDKEIIHNFTESVKAGQKIAIVGPTGAGKTTLVNLLMRFYEITSGDIKIDGVSIKDMTRSQVRSLFGMVLQDTWLFEGTIKDNLKFGNPKATDKQIKDACIVANIDHIINTMPNGYNFKLKDNSFSSGEKQLLTIARAMIENAPMLILDEATSSVDTRTEELIQNAMDNLTIGRTSFIIAHRLSTIKNADLILVMKDGNIIEKGNHKQLLELGGFYSELYNSQFSKQSIIEEE